MVYFLNIYMNNILYILERIYFMENLIGRKFGKLTVIQKAEKRKHGKKVFYLFRSMHFQSFKNKQKELFLKHEDQRELISSHSYFFRCFLLRNVIFFFFFSKWCPGWKRNLYLNVCLIYPLLFKKLCMPIYLQIMYINYM